MCECVKVCVCIRVMEGSECERSVCVCVQECESLRARMGVSVSLREPYNECMRVSEGGCMHAM